MKLQDELPVDHRLATVYRYTAGLGGVFLMVFGILGLFDHVGFLDTQGKQTLGLSSNGALSVLSIVFGAILILGAVIGGNFASTLNMVVGVIFILAGFVGLMVLDSSANRLAFEIPNVVFSFAFGFAVVTFGMYGRVSSHLPHDNPYWRDRESRAVPQPTGPKTFVKIIKPGPPNPIGH
jgi:predicted MFS family arabinose efflux permease